MDGDAQKYVGVTHDLKRDTWKARIHFAGAERYIGRYARCCPHSVTVLTPSAVCWSRHCPLDSTPDFGKSVQAARRTNLIKLLLPRHGVHAVMLQS